jgi:hypothetical protein
MPEVLNHTLTLQRIRVQDLSRRLREREVWAQLAYLSDRLPGLIVVPAASEAATNQNKVRGWSGRIAQ